MLPFFLQTEMHSPVAVGTSFGYEGRVLFVSWMHRDFIISKVCIQWIEKLIPRCWIHQFIYLGKGVVILWVGLIQVVKSTHIRYLLLAFFTIITFISHSGYVTSCMNPIDISLSTFLDMAFCLSPPTFLFFCRTRGKLGSIFNQCEATSRSSTCLLDEKQSCFSMTPVALWEHVFVDRPGCNWCNHIIW